MAVYGQMVLTDQGLALYAKAQTGVKLTFSRLQIGSGKLASGQDPTKLTALIAPIANIAINSITSSGNTSTIRGVFENSSLNAPTYSCELGLFAQDPDAGEILYSYVNAGDNGDTLPPISSGPFSEQYQIDAAVGNATDVTAEIVDGLYALASDVGDMSTVPTTSKTAAGAITELYQDISSRDGYGTTAGTGEAYTVTLNPAPQALVDGLRVTVKIHTDNTGAATLNVNGLGAKPLKKSNGNDFSAGQLKTGSIYTFVYNGTNFIAQGEGGDYGTAGAAQVLTGYTFGTDNGLANGTMPDKTGQTVGLSTLNDETGGKSAEIVSIADNGADQALLIKMIPPKGYYDGSNTQISLRLWGPKSSQIAAGQKIGWTDNTAMVGTYTSDATAAAGDMLSGKTAYVNGTKVTGTMVNRSGANYAAGSIHDTSSGQFLANVPDGYWDGYSSVILSDPAFIADNILNTANIFGLQGTAIAGKRSASGSGVLGASVWSSGGALTISGLAFNPSFIMIEAWSDGSVYYRKTYYSGASSSNNQLRYSSGGVSNSGGDWHLSNGYFSVTVDPNISGWNCTWIAYE